MQLLPDAFEYIVFFKYDFLKSIETYLIIIFRYVQPQETMTINKFQRPWLAFDFLAKVAYIGVLSIY